MFYTDWYDNYKIVNKQLFLDLPNRIQKDLEMNKITKGNRRPNSSDLGVMLDAFERLYFTDGQDNSVVNVIRDVLMQLGWAVQFDEAYKKAMLDTSCGNTLLRFATLADVVVGSFNIFEACEKLRPSITYEAIEQEIDAMMARKQYRKKREEALIKFNQCVQR